MAWRRREGEEVTRLSRLGERAGVRVPYCSPAQAGVQTRAFVNPRPAVDPAAAPTTCPPKRFIPQCGIREACLRICHILAGLVLAGAAAPASAADWTLVTVHPNAAAVFVDSSSIQRRGDMVTFTLWAIYRKRQKSGTDNARAIRRANCADLTFNDLQRTFLYRDRELATSSNRPAEQATTTSLNGLAIAFACEGPGTGRYRTVADPYKASKARGFWKQ